MHFELRCLEHIVWKDATGVQALQLRKLRVRGLIEHVQAHWMRYVTRMKPTKPLYFL